MEGLLGYENAVELIYNLSILIKESSQFAKSKEDTRFGPFAQELITNYDSLVNTEYDPYNISFPAAYQRLNQEDFENQFSDIMK